MRFVDGWQDGIGVDPVRGCWRLGQARQGGRTRSYVDLLRAQIWRAGIPGRDHADPPPRRADCLPDCLHPLHTGESR